jgi:two-component system, LytTR family, response regulator
LQKNTIKSIKINNKTAQAMLKTIIIDDEPLAISRLKRLLSRYEADFNIIAEAKNGKEGLELIEKHQPELIFLDIEMPEMNGFEMLSKLSYMPIVVFATAFDQYAIRAFEENSIDYLLKPIEAERLEKTVEKLKKFQQKPVDNPFNTNLLEMLEKLKPKKEMHSISVKSGERILFIPLIDIAFFEAEDKYVMLNTIDGKRHVTNSTVAALEEKLPDNFLKVSRAAIINTKTIKEVQKSFNGKYIVILKDVKASKIKTGSTFGDNLKKLMDN